VIAARTRRRLKAATLLGLASALLGGAAGAQAPALAPGAGADNPTPEDPSSWQCAQFARLFSGIEIFGDAWTWWDAAQGRYDRGAVPEAGAVLVFKPGGALVRGHVAVVDHVLTDRIIQVTHANWSPVDGRRGQIENEVTVVDVSPAGDWSAVKVWFKPAGALGSTVYPTFGFVYPGRAPTRQPAPGVFDQASRAALAAEVQAALR
jgi:surface antigen